VRLSQKTATVALFCDSRIFRVFGDKLSPKSATIVASVDRLLSVLKTVAPTTAAATTTTATSDVNKVKMLRPRPKYKTNIKTKTATARQQL